jgi:ankyrin repeat-rich membrane spanning protein
MKKVVYIIILIGVWLLFQVAGINIWIAAFIGVIVSSVVMSVVNVFFGSNRVKSDVKMDIPPQGKKLIKAVRRGKIDEVKSLLHETQTSDSINAALLNAVEKNNIEMAELLLNNGANADCVFSHTFIMDAIDKHVKILQFLLDKKAYTSSDALSKALTYFVKDGYVDIVKTLLSAGANPNCEEVRGLSPLIAAIAFGPYAELVKILLAAGADANYVLKATDNPQIAGFNALIAATFDIETDPTTTERYTEIVKILLAAGADVNYAIKSTDNPKFAGYTALMFASKNGYTEIVKELLAAGADVNTKDEK